MSRRPRLGYDKRGSTPARALAAATGKTCVAASASLGRTSTPRPRGEEGREKDWGCFRDGKRGRRQGGHLRRQIEFGLGARARTNWTPREPYYGQRGYVRTALRVARFPPRCAAARSYGSLCGRHFRLAIRSRRTWCIPGFPRTRGGPEMLALGACRHRVMNSIC